jgi:hypothetical protein
LAFYLLSIKRFYNQSLKGDISMAEENSTGSNLIWAVTTIIVVALIVGAVYYSGFLGGTKKEKIDINISAPSSNN